jgi:hypothetical protein
MAFIVQSPCLLEAEDKDFFNPVDTDKIFKKKKANTHEFREEPEQISAEAYKVFKSISTPVRDFCEELYWDGHVVKLQTVIQELRKSTSLRCDDCKALLKVLGSSCRVSASKMSKEKEAREAFLRQAKGIPEPSESASASPLASVEASPSESEGELPSAAPTPTAVPVLPARDPSALAIDAAVRAFLPLADTAGADEISLLTLEKLLDAIQKSSTTRIEEKEYFDTLFTYILPCFQEVHAARKRKEYEAFQKNLPSDPFLRRERILERQGILTHENQDGGAASDELFDF